jgi:hypothetical protein
MLADAGELKSFEIAPNPFNAVPVKCVHEVFWRSSSAGFSFRLAPWHPDLCIICSTASCFMRFASTGSQCKIRGLYAHGLITSELAVALADTAAHHTNLLQDHRSASHYVEHRVVFWLLFHASHDALPVSVVTPVLPMLRTIYVRREAKSVTMTG